jgi:ABC-type multidrug transport system fused ATPase/permease subunit
LNLFGDNANLSALARRYFWTVAIVTLLALIVGALEGTGVGLLIPLLSTFTNDLNTDRGGVLGFIQRFGGAHSRNERVLIVCALILVCMLLKSAFQTVENRFASWTDGVVGHDIRCSMAQRLQDVGYAFFLVQDPARLLNILSSESWKATEAVRIVLNRFAEAASVLVFGAMLCLVSWKLTLLVFLGGLITRMLQKWGENRLRDLSKLTVSANQQLADRMLFVVFAARLIRLFNTLVYEQKLFEQASDRLRRTNLDVENLSGTLGPVLEAVHGVLFLAVLLIAVRTGIDLPVLAAFLVLMNRLQPHLRAFEQASAAFASCAAHFQEVEWLLDPLGKPPVPQGHLPFEGLREKIEFRKVTFEYYDRGEPALRDASFTLHRGRSTALIGNSGAGKSTLVSLLCRLTEPASGTITVDDQELTHIRLADWLNCIAVAGQDVDLIDASIAENISYGRARLPEAEIAEILKTAGATFVDELPHGLDTVVGSQGLSLSGGQRQRIGIARALARKPEILIFDEATNAVDSETEDSIIHNLKNLPFTTTLIVISHRRSTLTACDDAVVLDHGRVVNTGSVSSMVEFYFERHQR